MTLLKNFPLIHHKLNYKTTSDVQWSRPALPCAQHPEHKTSLSAERKYYIAGLFVHYWYKSKMKDFA